MILQQRRELIKTSSSSSLPPSSLSTGAHQIPFMMWPAQQAFFFWSAAHPEGRWGVPVYTGRLRPKVQLLTHLYTIFHEKGTPFVYLLLPNGTPWVASNIYFHWVNCPFYLLVKLSFTLTSLETSLQSTIKVKSVRTFPEILVKLVTSPPPLPPQTKLNYEQNGWK